MTNITNRSLLEGDSGLSPKLRLLMAINLQASIQMRRRLQDIETMEERMETELEIRDEIALDARVEEKMTLSRACDLIVASYVAAMAIARMPGINDDAQFKWVEELKVVKTPVQWLASDIDYRVKNAIDANYANMAHVRLNPDRIAAIAQATERRIRAIETQRAKARSEVIAAHVDPDIKNLDEDVLLDLLEEGMVELGISWRETLAAAAERHQANFIAGMEAGKVMRPDSDLLMFLGPKAKAATLEKVKTAIESADEAGAGLVEQAA